MESAGLFLCSQERSTCLSNLNSLETYTVTMFMYLTQLFSTFRRPVVTFAPCFRLADHKVINEGNLSKLHLKFKKHTS